MNNRLVTWVKEEDLGIMTIDNPPVNALGQQVTAGITQCMQEMEEDQEVRVVIITGGGERAFMAGADIKELPASIKGGTAASVEFGRAGHAMFNMIDFFPRPTIAAINALALGGGCELALACDLRVASQKALFGLPEIKLGVFPGGGGTQRLPRLIGEARAKELMYLGNFISADEALQIGLVNRVVSHEEVLTAAKALGKEIAGRPGAALNLIKQCVDRGMQMTLEEGLRLEMDLFARVFLTEDAQEGIAAFIEKRAPKFKHR
ncbi:MAG: enoyl-CoA hydratase/isomerase family protein [Bacillota bacterium]